MDERYRSIAALAAQQHSVVSTEQLRQHNISSSMATKWARRGLIERYGERSFLISGAESTWEQRLTACYFDLEGRALVDGRSAARLSRLDGFDADTVEFLVDRRHRNLGRSGSAIVRSTSAPVGRRDVQRIGPLRVVRAERLIIDSPLFQFTQRETENAIDSAIRLRLVSEQRLRTRVIAEHRRGLNGSRGLLDAMVDTGGESRLERWFLALTRREGLPRPLVQKAYRADGGTIARVDFEFPGGLVVEVAGHATHSSRRQRQRDAERITLLTLRGKRVLTFTYEDVRDRPHWVVQKVRTALSNVA
jgi:hypothetical protein